MYVNVEQCIVHDIVYLYIHLEFGLQRHYYFLYCEIQATVTDLKSILIGLWLEVSYYEVHHVLISTTIIIALLL